MPTRPSVSEWLFNDADDSSRGTTPRVASEGTSPAHSGTPETSTAPSSPPSTRPTVTRTSSGRRSLLVGGGARTKSRPSVGRKKSSQGPNRTGEQPKSPRPALKSPLKSPLRTPITETCANQPGPSMTRQAPPGFPFPGKRQLPYLP